MRMIYPFIIYGRLTFWLRRKLRIELLKTTLMAMRGFRKSRVTAIAELDLNLLQFYVH